MQDNIVVSSPLHRASGQRQVDYSLDYLHLVVKSRTIQLKGWKFLLLSPYCIAKKLAIYNPQYIVINKRRNEAYVTLNSRLDAENLMQDALARGMFHERNEIDRRSRIFTLSAARILEDENPTFRIWAAREIGRSGLEPNFRYVRRSLTHHQLTLARKFGDLWLGGFVIEEPYKPRGDNTAPFHISLNMYVEPFEEYGVTCQLAVSNFLAQGNDIAVESKLKVFHEENLDSLASKWLEDYTDLRRNKYRREYRQIKLDFIAKFIAYLGETIFHIYEQFMQRMLWRVVDEYYTQQ
ncbi:hypothetical protein MP228_006608 [Amoeboaphelidium protococcarum]|nr:hypothetical protein MP228_006608 [Amoeboaphelidium protococcarum]